MSKAKKQPVAKKSSKKELSKVVFEKLSGSLTDFHLKEKKLENRLEKVSKRLASDIVKLLNKKETAWLPVNQVRFYIYANNLGIIWRANDKGIDPDFLFSIPTPRTIAAGLKIDF